MHQNKTHSKPDQHTDYFDGHYAGVGTMTDANTFANSHGWGIPGTVIESGNIHRLDPNQYKPNYDGVTLLLVEVKDGVQLTRDDTQDVSAPSSYAELRDYCDRWFKSVRVVTESMIVGEGTLNEGTLFKVDCNQMNRFFFLAKGRLRSFETRNQYIGDIEGAFWGRNSYVDVLNYGPFYHMFEQLSAYDLIGDQNATDIYQELVMMKTYKVEHDCISIPKPYNRWAAQGAHATFSHEFNMYGRESVSADCQDVRDLMFLVPTHRMTQWNAAVQDDGESVEVGRDTKNHGGNGIFVNYHDTYAPLMGLFSIIQDPIVGQRLTDDVEMLGEQTGSKVPDRSYRLSDDYLFEDMNYGTVINEDGVTMQKASLMPGDEAYALGSRLVACGMRNETTATFGAKRLNGIRDNTGFSEGSVEELDFDFVVRIYFTPVANPCVTPASGSNQAPRQATGTQSKDFDYYVSEAMVRYSIKSTDNVITSVSGPVENLGHDIVEVTYVNPMGQMSNRPFNGINIIVTRYSDGTTLTHKVIR